MKTLRGVAASPGAVVAEAYVHRPSVVELPDAPSADPERDTARVIEALDAVARDLRDKARETTGSAAEILEAQAAMARDPALRAASLTAVGRGVPAARAVVDAGRDFADRLTSTGNPYLAARAPDVRFICEMAARSLTGAPPQAPPRPVRPCIVIAEDLTPFDTAQLDPALVVGIATAGGSPTSHTSIVARGMEVPAVVGVRDLLEAVVDGRTVALDGDTGLVYLDPDDAVATQVRDGEVARQQRHERVRILAGEAPTATADGLRIEVAANVRGIEELRVALGEGAEGVGLLRTELLFIDRRSPPPVDEQSALLRAMRQMLGDRRLTVRTFDIGSDKAVPFLPARPEANPELGVRGIRLARLHPDLLDAQLEAVVAVSDLGPTAVMAPMVATVEEVEWFVDRVRKAGAPESLQVGVMIEVPAAVLFAAEIAARVDFVSIGTNDLGQYLHAADRRNPGLTELQDPFSPATLRAVDLVCRGADGRCRVAVCGEAAAKPAWAALAVGLGVTELSMQAASIPEVRATLRQITTADARDAVASALECTEATAARSIAEEFISTGERRSP